MDLTPRDINEKQFNDSFRGYNQEQVDLFLDEVAASFERAFVENQTFHHRLRTLEAQLVEARVAEDMLKQMLVTAQKTANETVEAAKTQAQNMIQEAESSAKQMWEEAEAKSKEVLSSADGQAQEMILQAIARENEATATLYESLRNFDRRHRERLQEFMEEQIRTLGALEAFSPSRPPAAVADLGGPPNPPDEIEEIEPEEALMSSPPTEDQRSINEQFWGE